MCGFGNQRRQLRAQERMQRQQLDAQEKLAADQAKTEENAKRRPVSTLLTDGVDSTNLTGAAGISGTSIPLARNTLLGA